MDSNTPSSSSKHKGGDLGMNASDASTQAQFAYTEEKGKLLTIILVSQLFGGTHLFVSFSSWFSRRIIVVSDEWGGEEQRGTVQVT